MRTIRLVLEYDGTRYAGTFRAGKPDGRGTLSFPGGARYEGEFRAGLMAAWLGAIPAVLVGGFGALLVVLIGRKLFADLYRVDTLEPPRR